MDKHLMEVHSSSGWFAGMLTDGEFEHYWPEIEKMMDLVPHTWEEFLTKDSLVERVLSKNIQVWVVGEDAVQSVMLTQVATYVTGPILQVIWGAGVGMMDQHSKEVIDATMDYFAHSQGCRMIDVIGRCGWEKVLKDWGFERKAVIMSRPVRAREMQ